MSDRIRFVFNDRVRALSHVNPTMTVLDYLRTVERSCGTKEGCAEGDCGACTVVLGLLVGDSVKYRAVNSCLLFLPVLDGKQLITVEHLKMADGTLHPVQRALVDCHGSQCGFCTPGFVMSLFALYKSEKHPSPRQINDGLAGNLCRCTGYRPILQAARQMYSYDGGDQFDQKEPATKALLQSIRRNDTLEIHNDGRNYYSPTTVSNLADLRRRYPDSVLLAGGSDIGLWVTKQHRDLDTLIHLGDIPELVQTATTPTHLEIGAAVTYSDASAALASHYPDCGELLRRVGSVQIRNVGTVGGNIATASPIGDSIPPLMALGASVVLRQGDHTREVNLDDFFLGYRSTAIASGEFIENIRIPIHGDQRVFRAYKVSKRWDQDISSVCAAYSLQLDGRRVNDIRICYGGMAATPQRATECERTLIGTDWTREAVNSACSALERDFTPITDFRASSEYRRLVAQNLLLKFYLESTGDVRQTRVASYSGDAA
ncbi:MAG: FAD-binding molybdopterin dehydrogenase [Gemmatimonas sp. SG8_17]|nr:MAG: FAD-binding molybdopterin dehydrogenase [Gemmatimonas sp. SG8_17]